jgi:hypothetical protein
MADQGLHLIPWLLSIAICTEPVPAECIRRSLDEITSNPVCVAVSQSCTVHRRWLYLPPDLAPQEARGRCVDVAVALVRAERAKGYARGGYPECMARPDEP